MPLRGRTNLTDCHFFFVTTTVINFLKVFNDMEVCDILIRNIKHYQERYKFEILAYVIMPSHFYWIIEVNPEKGSVSDIMRDIKKYSGWDIMDLMEKKHPEYMNEFMKAAMTSRDQKRKFWMKRFDDEVIRNENMLWTRLNYIHNNPVEAGLVNDIVKYKYSSARNYILNDHSVIAVNTSLAGTRF